MAKARTSCECIRREVDWTHFPEDLWRMEGLEEVMGLM